MPRKNVVFLVLLSVALVFSACSKSVDVGDLQLEEDLMSVGESETGIPVSEVDCPETIDDAEDGSEFSCDLVLEDGSTVTVNMTLEEDDGKFQATYQGIE